MMIRRSDMRFKHVSISISFLYTLIFTFTFEHLSLANFINNDGECLDENQMLIKYQMRARLKKDVKLIKVDCGDICDTSINSEITLQNGKIFSY